MAASLPGHAWPGRLVESAMGHRIAALSAHRGDHRALAAALVLGSVALVAAAWGLRDQLTTRVVGGHERAASAVFSITSQPPGAAITVDDKERGRTPAGVAVAPRSTHSCSS